MVYASLSDAVIGFERTFITVSEGVGVVELCAVVISPEAACPIDFPFEIDLSTDDNTAGKWNSEVKMVADISNHYHTHSVSNGLSLYLYSCASDVHGL